MYVTVFGANGRVGRLVVAKLLNDGHVVTAFVHDASPFKEQERLKICQGDVRQTADVAKALVDGEAVISTLGSWGTPTKDILSSGMRVIIPAMRKRGIKRIVSLTGAAAKAPGDRWGVLGKLSHVLLGLLAPKILRDGEVHLQLLAASDLDWTVVRSPVMNERGGTTYKLTTKLPGMFETINRYAVAQAMVDQLTAQDHLRAAPLIHRF